MVNISSRVARQLASGQPVRRGGASQRAGSNFQKTIVASLAWSGSALALYELPPCGGRYISRGKFVGVEMPCDFIGALKPSGRAVYFDAKSIGDRGVLRASDPKIVEPHQVSFLYVMQSAGALAGMLVECKRTDSYYWVEAWMLIPRRDIHVTDPQLIRIGPTSQLVDFRTLSKLTEDL